METLELTNDIRKTVVELDKLQKSVELKRDKALEGLETANGRADTLYEQMGFRERYLFGFFGGDRESVKERKQQLKLAAEFNEKAQLKSNEVSAINKKIYTELKTYLERNDAKFQKLMIPWQAAKELQDAVDSFKGKIYNALSEIDDAQSMETMDLFTKNAGISVMSSIENSEAEDAIRHVKNSAEDFQAEIKKYNKNMSDLDLGDLDIRVGDFTDLVFDLAFDGFDFMSLFVLDALDDAERSMNSALSKVNGVAEIAEENFKKADNAVGSYIAMARRDCTLG